MGYYRLNVVKFRNACRARQIASDKEAAERLKNVIGYSTLMRLIYDQIVPSSRAMFAITQLLGLSVDELFDPVSGQTPAERKEDA